MKLLTFGLALSTAALGIALSVASGTRLDAAATPSPITIGSQVAGMFDDATGHSGQSHLIYAANSRVWWLFTLTSAADAEGGSNHFVKAFHSSGPDLTTATWIAALDSPAAPAGTSNGTLGGGRSLGVAYLDNTPLDVIHADISMGFDGQDGRTGHIRAIVTATSISWSSWNFFDEPAATWTMPRANVVGVSTGKFIHTGGPMLQQEVDANARLSLSPDTGAAWTSGFTKPAVIDNSMLHQDNALAFAPLADDAMLAVYDNGRDTEPNQTNLRYKRSGAGGAWSGVSVGTQLGGDGDVFDSAAVIDQNDWSLVPVSTRRILVFRRKADGSGIDAASYDVATNTWSPLSPAPPSLGAGQSVKSGAGVFGATDGSHAWVCVINKDAANSILCSTFDGAAWTSWAVVAGTDLGTHDRHYLAGSPRVGGSQVGLIWTEGPSPFDIVTTSLMTLPDTSPDTTPPSVSLATPADGATVSGSIAVTASASDNVGIAGVRFQVDGIDIGVEVTTAPYSIPWDTATSASGLHTVSAVARDDAGNTATAAATVTVSIAAPIPQPADPPPPDPVPQPAPAPPGPAVETTVSVDGAGTVRTAPFNTASAGDVLVAFVSSASSGFSRQGVTVSGAGLAWTLVRRADGESGSAEVWAATATTALSAAVVTSRPSASTSRHQSLTVVAFTGASGIGAIASGSGSGSLPTVRLRATGADSLVYGVGFDPDRAVARTLPAGQVMLHQWVDRVSNDTCWVQALGSAASSPALVTIGATAPSRDSWNLVAIELVR